MDQMSDVSVEEGGGLRAPVSLKRILVAIDASEHSDAALREGAKLAASAGGTVTGIHAYAAALHDRRFRQMEGGLPERYRNEEEMEHQRDVHDDLITNGLSIISDSYHDTGKAVCDEIDVPYQRLSPEGKNYRRVTEAASGGDFDVLALGIKGIGAIPGAIVGTVCERTVRRCPIDTLVIKSPQRPIGVGPIVVALDGSDTSFGCLKTALDLGRRFDTDIHVIAAYDPFYHYVAFNKISQVLSDEAGKVFRFKEQEKLHEELIDDGIAKIYEGHLAVAGHLCQEEGVSVATQLLAGKPYKVIEQYLEKVNAGLLVIGKTGIHSDANLDIGGVTENLLRLAPCNIWIGQKTFVPPIEVVAEETISWSKEAEEQLGRAPEFARGMARKAIIRYAQEEGHTYITRSIVEKVAEQIMPGRQSNHQAGNIEQPDSVAWSEEALALLGKVQVPSDRENMKLRAEKIARMTSSHRALVEITVDHISQVLDVFEPQSAPPETSVEEFDWDAAALARISRIPEMMRQRTKDRIEAVAAARGQRRIDSEIVELGLEEARKAMKEAMDKGGHPDVDGSA